MYFEVPSEPLHSKKFQKTLILVFKRKTLRLDILRLHYLVDFRVLWVEAAEAVVKTDEAIDRIGLRISSSDKHFVVVKNFE